MHILLLGATGRTGKEILKQSLEKDYLVTAYVRNPDKLLPHKNLKVIRGKLDDISSLSLAMKNVDVVLVTLGNPSISTKIALFETAIPNIIEAMKKAKVSRIIVLSALGVGKTMNNVRPFFRTLPKIFLRRVFNDHYKGEALLVSSNLKWTTLHPGILSNRCKSSFPKVYFTESGKKVKRIPITYRKDVAKVMLEKICDENTYEKQLVMTS
ncbi:SDR family oxidoreductase [Actinomyces sp. zg-332]|uniref:NAD(P)-binding oxidoreductase n=1 Tax=Actinomyces sp. zg-332 TaxID=2708340 RepID=UPI00141DC413|nr:NAD(P)-binding oxidoreductase [Actinomyces sp. zg-332]QPK93597.1 SDR family oxidoreductase [Actinomyces sp. zg-332]